MDPLNPRSSDGSVFKGIALAAILTLTLVGLVVPVLLGGLDFDTFTLRLIFAALSLVAVVGLVQIRFLVLPSIIRGYQTAHTLDEKPQPIATGSRAVNAPTTVNELAQQCRILAMSFSIAPSMYGLVLAVQSGVGWLALPFTGVALFTLIVLWSYVDGALDEVRNSLAMRGEP